MSASLSRKIIDQWDRDHWGHTPIADSNFQYRTREDLIKRFDDEIQRLRELLEEAEQALKVIASQHLPRHAEEEYWLRVSHEQCAVVLATDTKIARNALAALAKLRSEFLGLTSGEKTVEK